MTAALTTSRAGILFLQSWESFKNRPYDDGFGYMTIGWGHRILRGESFPQPLNYAEGLDLLLGDLKTREADVNKLVKVQVTQYQFDALVSFAFNVGSDIDEDTKPEGLGDSTLLKYLNEGRIIMAAEQFPKWIYAGGKQVNGLKRRRAAERHLFLTGEYIGNERWV